MSPFRRSTIPLRRKSFTLVGEIIKESLHLSDGSSERVNERVNKRVSEWVNLPSSPITRSFRFAYSRVNNFDANNQLTMEINSHCRWQDKKVYGYPLDASFGNTTKLCLVLWIDHSKQFGQGRFSLLLEQNCVILAMRNYVLVKCGYSCV